MQGIKDKFGTTIGSSIPEIKSKQSPVQEKPDNLNSIRQGINQAAHSKVEALSFREPKF
jgi:hypothetical protein